MKKNDVDKILNTPKKNPFAEPRPISINPWVLLIIPLLYLIFVYADYFTENQATILGIIGSTIIAFLILIVTLNNEKRSEFRSARKNAKILSEVLGSIYNQIEQTNDGSRHLINYPENWIDFYAHCSIYLEYDYLQYLLREFDIVRKINNCIVAENGEGLMDLIEYRNKTITDWGLDFEIIMVKNNLLQFASGYKESKPWKLQKPYVEFMEFFRDNYSEKVKELTVEYLCEHGGTCGAREAEQHVMSKLRQEAALNTGKHKFVAVQNKAMLNAIFRVYLSLKADDEFNLCWGELTLKSDVNMNAKQGIKK